MRLVQKISLILLAALAATAAARAADSGQTQLVPNGRNESVDRDRSERVSFQAILVIASDEGATDSSLSAYEATLKRMLRFKSYRRAGVGSASVSAGGEATVVIGRGHSLDLWVTDVDEQEITYGVRWFDDSRTFANTKVTRLRRSVYVLGGPAVKGGGGHYAVIVMAN